MSVADLLEKAGSLSDEEKGELICGIVGDMKAMALKGLVETVEEKFGVQASSGMGFDPAMLAGLGAAKTEEVDAEPTEFDVVLTGAGDAKIKVIKEVRAITGLGLKDAKGLVDSAPKAVKEKLSREEAEKVQGQLEEVGAKVEVKPSA